MRNVNNRHWIYKRKAVIWIFFYILFISLGYDFYLLLGAINKNKGMYLPLPTNLRLLSKSNSVVFMNPSNNTSNCKLLAATSLTTSERHLVLSSDSTYMLVKRREMAVVSPHCLPAWPLERRNFRDHMAAARCISASCVSATSTSWTLVFFLVGDSLWYII